MTLLSNPFGTWQTFIKVSFPNEMTLLSNDCVVERDLGGVSFPNEMTLLSNILSHILLHA